MRAMRADGSNGRDAADAMPSTDARDDERSGNEEQTKTRSLNKSKKK